MDRWHRLDCWLEPKSLRIEGLTTYDLENHCTVSVFSKRPPKTIVLSALFSKRPPKTIVLANSFSNGLHQNPCTVTFFQFALKEGFRKPWYCQHFSEGTFPNHGTVSIFKSLPLKTMVLSAFSLRGSPKTIVVSAFFKSRPLKTMVLSAFL